MCNIIGQEQIISFIDSTELCKFPRTILLCGEEGCGKHLVSDYISKRYNLNLIDITTEISVDYIEEIQNRAEPYIYLIDLDSLSIKEQNVILKFIEEPLKNSVIILICKNSNSVIETVNNRCQKFTFLPYKKSDLESFIDTLNKDIILNICTTPGQCLKYKGEDLFAVCDLASKLVDKIQFASLSNTLTISNKLSFGKTDNDKIDCDLFMKILLNTIVNKIKLNADGIYKRMFLLTKSFIEKSWLKGINKKDLFENFIISFWMEAHTK